MSLLIFWYGGWGIAIPRIVLGLLLLAHGWTKVRDLARNARNFSGMGFRPGALWGTGVALLEFLGGIAVILGLGMPYVCLLFMAEFAVIIVWKWAKQMPFAGGWELDAVIFALLLVLFTLSGGLFLI